MRNLSMMIMALLLISAVSCRDNREEKLREVKDTEITPPRSRDNVVMTVEGNPDLGTFAAKMNYVDAADTLQGDGSFTIFAPNNLAYSRIYRENGERNFEPDNEEVILFHFVRGKYTTGDLKDSIQKTGGSISLPSIQGEAITFELIEGALRLTGGTGKSGSIVSPDIEASNGVVHIIDLVLLPYEIKEKVVVSK